MLILVKYFFCNFQQLKILKENSMFFDENFFFPLIQNFKFLYNIL